MRFGTKLALFLVITLLVIQGATGTALYALIRTTLIDDAKGEKLDFPTNCAFGGPGLKDLYFANLEGDHFSRIHTNFVGHPLYHQR